MPILYWVIVSMRSAISYDIFISLDPARVFTAQGDHRKIAIVCLSYMKIPQRYIHSIWKDARTKLLVQSIEARF